MKLDEEKKKREREMQIEFFKEFHSEYGCLQYIAWFCWLALLLDAAYKALTGGDWVTPLLDIAITLGIAVFLFIIASLG